MNFLNRIDKDITLLLDNLPVGIIRFNNAKKCIYANKFVINLFKKYKIKDVEAHIDEVKED